MTKGTILKEPPTTGEYVTLMDPSVAIVAGPVFRSQHLSSDMKIVYAAICRLSAEDAEFGLEELMEACGLGPIVCQRALRSLIKEGFIIIDEQASTLEVVRKHPIFIEGYLAKE